MNQKINIYNYEAFLLDYSEGRLSSEQEAELMLFLSKHPDLNFDPETLHDTVLTQEHLPYLNKAELKKSEKDLVSDEMMVEYIEGTLNEENKKQVEVNVLYHTGIKKELDLYLKTILRPDKDIVFDEKSKLKRKNKVILFSLSEYVRYGIAAAVLLLLGLTFWWNSSIEPVSPLAKKESEKKNPTDYTIHEPMASKTFSPYAVTETKTLDQPNSKSEKKKHEPSHHPIEPIDNYVAQQQNMKPEPKQDINSVTEPTSEKEMLADQHSELKEKNNTVVVISDDDETIVAQNQTTHKKSLWSLVGKTLKNLNKAGVKSVDGEESQSSGAKDYLLTFGTFSVSHSQANQ